MKKKGQISLGEAPSVVLIVGFVFLLMATIAYISEEYQDGFTTDVTQNIVNESVGTVADTAVNLAGTAQCNAGNFAVVIVTNLTGGNTIEATNYTATTDGTIRFTGAEAEAYNNTPWQVSYSYDHSGAACNVTTGLNAELLSNTSIAGIVLTISLVGIVLSILIGIFIASRRNTM